MAETNRPDEVGATEQQTGRINIWIETPGPSPAKGNHDPTGQTEEPPEPPNERAARGKQKQKSKGQTSYQLRPAESFRKGVKRIVRRQLDKALEQAKKLGSPRETADVHDIRNRFKRLRAVLRLVRNELGEGAYRRHDAAIRNAGQVLSPVRNGKVVLRALATLKERSNGAAGEPFEIVDRFLRARQWDVRNELLQNERNLNGIRNAIEETRKEVKDWILPRGARRAVRRGLKQAYKRAYRAFEAAESAPTDEHLHEFRKQAKYFYYELQMVELLGPPSNKGLEENFHDLEQSLGEDHDLAMLRHQAIACQKGGLTDKAEAIIALIDERRHQVQGQTLCRARQFFRKPGNGAGKKLAAWSKKIKKTT